MTTSYSNALLKYVLTHYIEIMYGKVTPEEMQDSCKGKSHKNPLETALIWKSDLDQSIVSLSTRHHGWADALPGMTDSVILHLSQSNKVSGMQRQLISDCVLKGCPKFCKRTNATFDPISKVSIPGPEICYSEGIITRCRKFLNGEVRDESGKFKVRVTNGK